MTWQGYSTTVLQQPKKAQARLLSKKHFQVVISPQNLNQVKDSDWWQIPYRQCLGMIGSSKLLMMMIRVRDSDQCWSYKVVSNLVGRVLHDNTWQCALFLHPLPDFVSDCAQYFTPPHAQCRHVKSTLMIKMMIGGFFLPETWVFIPVILPNYERSNCMSGQQRDSSSFLSSKKIDEQPAVKRFFLANL